MKKSRGIILCNWALVLVVMAIAVWMTREGSPINQRFLPGYDPLTRWISIATLFLVLLFVISDLSELYIQRIGDRLGADRRGSA